MVTADAKSARRRKAAWLAALLGGLLLVVALATPRPAAAASYWVPSATESWQWNLAKPVEPTVDAEVYDIDMFENEASVVAALHAQGRHVVCYMDAGSWEEWRPDAKEFPASVLGSTYAGFTNEKWLDIRQLSILEPIMTKRLEICKAKGFDGVEADNIEGWENKSGFPLTTADQLVYNEWLANEAHSLGLSIAMKNDVEQTKELQPYFDWDLTEECAGRKLVVEGKTLNECYYLKPFTEAHKAVWSVEYNAFKLEPSQFCPEANKEGFLAVKKNVELDAWQAPCWAQGDWVGKKGADGYDLLAFNGSSDLSNMPGVTVTLVKGSRLTWASPTTDIRALESPDGSSRTAAAYSDPTEVSAQLHFEHAYKGNLHLYVVDWDSAARRETITAGTQTATLAGAPGQTTAEDEKANHGFNQGDWVSFPINVAAGTTLPINVKRNAGTSAVLSAIMLGDAKPSTPPLTVSTAPEGTWLTDKYGSSGYLLAGWDGVQDASDMPGVTTTLQHGGRYQWAANTTDVRDLQSPDGLTRNAATYYDPNEIKLQMSFANAYSGNLHLYALDWDSTVRRETITVNDGSGPRTVSLSSEFHNGAWVSVPINVAAGGSVSITVLHNAGPNAVLSGVFLGEGGAPPDPAVTSAPQGAWPNSAGSAGYDLAAWNGSSGDLSYLPNASVSLLQGNRWQWAAGSTDPRALTDVTGGIRNIGTYYDANEIQLKLNFSAPYTGNLHLYAVDWDKLTRREIITVNGQSVALGDFSEGAWVSFPIKVEAGGSVTITVDRTFGLNAVLSGIFLGEGSTTTPGPTVAKEGQGTWANTVGSAGYDLAGWAGTSDTSYLPNASLSVAQGSRWEWAANTTDARALTDPGGQIHNAATYYDPNEIKLNLNFTAAYNGSLHLYALDWDSQGRREMITVNGQSTTIGEFTEGAWITFPINVAAGETVTISVSRLAGGSAVLSGVFLGTGGPPAGPTVAKEPQGSWVGTFGSAGYALAAWNGSSDLTSLGSDTLTVEQASRYTWVSSTTDVRALESPTVTGARTAATYYEPNEIKLKLSFPAAYNGSLHLYALDWDSQGRREVITVNGQSGVLSSEFVNGAWMTFPINVPAGGTVTITVTRLAGPNAVLSGIFLG